MAPISAPSPSAFSSASSEDFVTTALSSSINLYTRALLSASNLYARDGNKKSFWDKYKWYIIGGLAALPPQLLLGWWYLRRRKAKKARLAAEQESREELHNLNQQRLSRTADSTANGSAVDGRKQPEQAHFEYPHSRTRGY